MAKIKVRVRYPTAFAGMGLGDVQGNDVVEVDEAVGTSLIGEGFADPVESKRTKTTETATTKLKDKDS